MNKSNTDLAKQAIFYHPDIEQCLSKIVKYYSRKNNEAVNYPDAVKEVEQLGILEKFDCPSWKKILMRLVRKYRHSFKRSDRPFNEVFGPEAFEFLVRHFVPQEELKWRRQKVSYEDLCFVLHVATRKIFQLGCPAKLARKYFVVAAANTNSNPKNKKRIFLKEKKVSKILGILTEYKLLSVKGGRVNTYFLGERNPYSENFIGLTSEKKRREGLND